MSSSNTTTYYSRTVDHLDDLDWYTPSSTYFFPDNSYADFALDILNHEIPSPEPLDDTRLSGSCIPRKSPAPAVAVTALQVSTPSSSNSNGSRNKRARSKIACRSCHQRRVRCDASSHGIPCTNCRHFGKSDCAFIESRRARGKRGRFENISRRDQQSPPCFNVPEDDESNSNDTNTSPKSSGQQSCASSVEECNQDNSSAGDTVIGVDISTPADETPNQLQLLRRPEKHESGRLMYLGEASPFTWLMHHPETGKELVHVPLPEEDAQNYNVTCHNSAVRDQTGLQLPLTDLQETLLENFFSRFLPIWPILHKKTFTNALHDGKVSPVLMLSVLFTGALHTESAVLERAGFRTRQEALELFYDKARRIYDDDVEADRVCILQSMFMLQFRYRPTVGHRDSAWWFTGAVGLAQAIGMHRSASDTDIYAEERRLWKKLWWCIFIRDRQLAISIGKPMLIDPRDCDVERLSMNDFVDGESLSTALFSVAMMDLCHIIADLIRHRFSPSPTHTNEPTTHSTLPSTPYPSPSVSSHLALQTWLNSLSGPIEYHRTHSRDRFTIILHLAYYQTLLLLHKPRILQPRGRGNGGDVDPEGGFSTQMAWYAADRITELVHDLLKDFRVVEFPIYIKMSIFTATAFYIRSAEASSSSSSSSSTSTSAPLPPSTSLNWTLLSDKIKAHIAIIWQIEHMYSATRKWQLVLRGILRGYKKVDAEWERLVSGWDFGGK